MLRDIAIIISNGFLILSKGWLRVCLPALVLVYLATLAPTWAYVQLNQLQFPIQAALSVWIAALSLGVALAVTTLLTAAFCGLSVRLFPRALMRLVHVWLLQATWLIIPAILLAASLQFTELINYSLQPWADAHALDRLSNIWATAPTLEIATGVGIYGLFAVVTGIWLWPPLAILRLSDELRSTRSLARRMLQRIPSLEWSMVIFILAVVPAATFFPAVSAATLVVVAAWPAIATAALQRSNEIYRRSNNASSDITGIYSR
ncbi:hypothetical protein [Halorhodospira halochloris]|uniref:hypothetical protein n=1 Tax=Halorhodospira halochloris TaxID=1052 RepID=UPI001EE7AE70|nr:hypothetical protein [Halorhodospira halochloris]MCG5548237.1 hypothetical protein [Halorhodospira halochloris]